MQPLPSVRRHFASILVTNRPNTGFGPCAFKTFPKSPPRSCPMIGVVRSATLCAIVALGLVSATSSDVAADKAFKRAALEDAAIKLEAQMQSVAGPISKPLAKPLTDAEAALRRNDLRT